MAKYRKKPVVIEAIQLTDHNINEVVDFIGLSNIETVLGTSVGIRTLEGVMRADRNDYIIKGIQGEVYPCKPDIFEQTYERVEDE